MVGQNLTTTRQPSTVTPVPRATTSTNQVPPSGSGDRPQPIIKTQPPQPSPVVAPSPSKPISKPASRDTFPWLMETDDFKEKEQKPIVTQIGSKPLPAKVILL